MVAKDVDLQASAAEVCNATRGRFRSKGRDGCFPAEPRFFCSADHFERDASSLFDMTHERVAVASFARSAGGHRAIAGHAEFVYDFFEMAERLHALFKNVFAETMAQEHAFAEAQRIALV